MSDAPLRDWLTLAELAEPDERLALVAFVAGQAVAIDDDERNGAIRRAQLLLAAGGDPRRRLELAGRAVGAVAADLDDPGRRGALAAGLVELESAAAEVRVVLESVQLLRADGDLAWKAFAMALLAEELGEVG